MLDMVHYNGRFVARMETIFIVFFGFIALSIYIWHAALLSTLV